MPLPASLRDALRIPAEAITDESVWRDRRRLLGLLAASPTLAATGWFDMGAVGALVAAHQSGRSDHGRQIWQFFMLEKSLKRLFAL